MTRLRLAGGIGTVAVGDTAYAAVLPGGPILVFDGTAALVWREVYVDGDRATLTERVRAHLADAPDDLDAAVDAFIVHLRDAGLVVADDGLGTGRA